MKKQRQGLNRYIVLQDAENPKTAKQDHRKYEAKAEHQLSPGGPSNKRKLWSNQLK